MDKTVHKLCVLERDRKTNPKIKYYKPKINKTSNKLCCSNL